MITKLGNKTEQKTELWKTFVIPGLAVSLFISSSTTGKQSQGQQEGWLGAERRVSGWCPVREEKKCGSLCAAPLCYDDWKFRQLGTRLRHLALNIKIITTPQYSCAERGGNRSLIVGANALLFRASQFTACTAAPAPAGDPVLYPALVSPAFRAVVSLNFLFDSKNQGKDASLWALKFSLANHIRDIFTIIIKNHTLSS